MNENYKSPINLIVHEMQMNMENGIVSAVQSYGIDVDKDELIKALRYDREQYDAGFSDGQASMRGEISWEAFRLQMKEYAEMDDEEIRHSLMDGLMCRTLRSLGYGNGVDIFDETDKWYA